jgi:hypothetical protein
MTLVSQRDVVFTPFMLRVRGALDGAPDRTAVALRPSEVRSLARAVDDWFNYRTRAEQVISEANAMLEGRAPLFDVEDEAGTGRLAFTVRWRDRWCRFLVGEAGRRGWVVLERPGHGDDPPVEPVDRDVLEELLVAMIQEREG